MCQMSCCALGTVYIYQASKRTGSEPQCLGSEPNSLLTGCASLDKSLNLSEPRSPQLPDARSEDVASLQKTMPLGIKT